MIVVIIIAEIYLQIVIQSAESKADTNEVILIASRLEEEHFLAERYMFEGCSRTSYSLKLLRTAYESVGRLFQRA